jgi:hypothetical protein
VTCFFCNTDDKGTVEAINGRAVIVDAFDAVAVAAAGSGAGLLDALMRTHCRKPGDATVLAQRIASRR